uniref:Uncharacterized protein n=1 Tax=Micrurus paraensis TaxID=1970185 RepID=A0A2D4K2C2_9SAUR
METSWPVMLSQLRIKAMMPRKTHLCSHQKSRLTQRHPCPPFQTIIFLRQIDVDNVLSQFLEGEEQISVPIKLICFRFRNLLIFGSAQNWPSPCETDWEIPVYYQSRFEEWWQQSLGNIVDQLQPLLLQKSILTITHDLVTSCLDNCNVLYLECPLKTRRLNMVEISSAEVVRDTICSQQVVLDLKQFICKSLNNTGKDDS